MRDSKDIEDALVELGRVLQASQYAFVTITPESHRRVNARPSNPLARTLRDVFGWNRSFTNDCVSPEIIERLRRCESLLETPPTFRSGVRFSTIGRQLYVHSSYPTDDATAVFFGPDTYRFVALLEREVVSARRVVDVGCGAGAGGLSLFSRCADILLADINPMALRYARVNARLCNVPSVDFVQSDVLANVKGQFDVVIANPPYMKDANARLYRDGGGGTGTELSLRIVEESLTRLAKGGKLVLYTGSPVVAGRDLFFEAVSEILERPSISHYEYRELDPDVFGEELDSPLYADVDRIAVVSLVVTMC